MAFTLTLNAPAYLSFTDIVLTGDFKITISNFNFVNPNGDFPRLIGEANLNTNNIIYRNDGTHNEWNFRASNATGAFPLGAAKPTTKNGKFTFERVGSQGTITYLGVSTTATVPTGSFTFNSFNRTNTTATDAVWGNVVVEKAGSIVYNWDFDNTDHALTNVTETITGNTAIGSGVVVGNWTKIPFKWAGSQLSFNALPNGAQAANPSGGWTCTGLDRLANGNWLVGNAGLAQDNATPLTPSLIELSTDYQTIVNEINMTPVLGNNTIQGVAVDTDGSYWLASGAGIVHVTSAGALIETFAISVNGLALDTTRGTAGSLWYIVAAGTAIKRFDIALETTVVADQITLPAAASIPDHLHYSSNLIYLTQGTSGANGDIYVFDATTKEQHAYIAPLAQAQAIEGAYISGNVLYIANDGGFHTNATPAISAIIEYNLTGTFSTANITISGIPNGSQYIYLNDASHTEIFRGLLTFAAEAATTPSLPLLVGSRYYGYWTGTNAPTDGSGVTGITL
jgi:hypothetical protein